MNVGKSVLWLRAFILTLALGATLWELLRGHPVNALPAAGIAVFYGWLTWEALRRRNDTE